MNFSNYSIVESFEKLVFELSFFVLDLLVFSFVRTFVLINYTCDVQVLFHLLINDVELFIMIDIPFCEKAYSYIFKVFEIITKKETSFHL